MSFYWKNQKKSSWNAKIKLDYSLSQGKKTVLFNDFLLYFIDKKTKEAKNLILKRNLYKNRSDDLVNKKIVLQNGLFKLEESITNQSLMKTLKEMNAFTNNYKMSNTLFAFYIILLI